MDFRKKARIQTRNNMVISNCCKVHFFVLACRYAYGKVSPKVDVYAFGVVLYELISAKEAIVKESGSIVDSKGLVALFEDVFSSPDPADFNNVVDPRLGDNYPFDSIRKMAQLARACTHENPQLRPSMRSIVVALLTLSSTTEDWDVGCIHENQALMNLSSGRYRWRFCKCNSR
ncbi:hypothetical protein AQUCO_29300002v1 [Aquilegia coerulea]|uniref:Serine-threonine/tyrosine-protein kinase catalytic domain-containing protein n=1 Tax=Aquilegia coerulea TaxID=218851 RepID=A0A2G5C0I3_AQUCA|nr:hypothetical protein AQUCO_29300002v1 [Aquilegia coerulea]